MICPRCQDTVLLQHELRGISIDACPRCQGVWLDRGELDQLHARRQDHEVAAAAARGAVHPSDLRRPGDHDDDDDDDDELRRGRRPDRERRPRSRWQSLLELFD